MYAIFRHLGLKGGGKERDEGREGEREGEGRGGRQGGRVIGTCYMATVVCKYSVMGSIYLFAVAMRVSHIG